MHFVFAAVFFVRTNLPFRTVILKKLQVNPSLAASLASPTIQKSEEKAF